MKRLRSASLLLLGAVIAALLTYLLTRQPAETPTETPLLTEETAAPAEPALPEGEPAPPTEEPSGPPPPHTATGTIHFERKESEEHPAATLDFSVQGAMGTWYAPEHTLRITLFNSPVNGDEIGQIELKFLPTAQAFDRNDLESATLSLRSETEGVSPADVLNSVEWSGSLPSPQTSTDSGESIIQLSTNGSGSSSDAEAWHQFWNIKVEVPVTLQE